MSFVFFLWFVFFSVYILVGAAFGGRGEGCFLFCLERERLFEVFPEPAKVQRVGSEFTQTGLIWDCNEGYMLLGRTCVHHKPAGKVLQH